MPTEGLLVLKDGKWIVLRVPYPLGFYTKWLDGRIDDPKAGVQGRGLWATVSTRWSGSARGSIGSVRARPGSGARSSSCSNERTRSFRWGAVARSSSTSLTEN